MNEVAGDAYWPRDFSTEFFVNSRTQGHCLGAVFGKAGALGYLESAAILVNERINYLAQVTEFPLV